MRFLFYGVWLWLVQHSAIKIAELEPPMAFIQERHKPPAPLDRPRELLIACARCEVT